MTELQRRIQRSITHLPDRLSSPKGEAVRREWATAMAGVMGGHLVEDSWLGLVPVHPHLWTDPVVIRLFTGTVVMDHPEVLGQFEDHMRLNSRRVAVYDCPRWWSLYAGRHPRLVVCPDKGEEVQLSDLCNRLSSIDWHGPWEAPPSLAYAPALSAGGSWRSVVTVLNPVDPTWIDRKAH